uniref:hypothetical protein n=1 Tax=uncultured Tenacibaculum sp. TaxID=174713 RepID=UPI0026259307|nr:hypothetical protein [uncultured Tenacibaculum sp.]
MKKIVTVRGTGQLNGPVKINKTVEIEEEMAQKFMGRYREDVITEFLNVHYPGVKINPRQISVNVVSKKQKKMKRKSIGSSKIKNTLGTIGRLGGKSIVKTAVGGSIIGGVVNSLFEENETGTEKSKRIRRERYIDDLDQSVKEKTAYMEHLKIPIDLDDLTDMLDDLIYRLKSNKWKPTIGADDEDEAKLMNKLMDAYFVKYSMGVSKLERLGVSDNLLNNYKSELTTLKKKKFLGKNSYILLLIGFFIVLGVLSLIYD